MWLAPPFDVILGDELRRRAAIAKADEATRAGVEEALRQRHVQVEARNEQRPQGHELILVGADSPTTPSEVVGWSQINMVALTKLLSNPTGPLKTLLEGEPRPPRRQSAQPSQGGEAIAVRHPHPGRIIKAIIRVLAERQEPMQAKEVHAAVEALLGESVRWASVKAALAANIAGPSPRFVRVARGRYMIRP